MSYEPLRDEIEAVRQQLAECQAALVVKDEALRAANHSCVEDWPLLREALAIQPSTEALEKLWGEPVAWRFSKGPITKLDSWSRGGAWEPLYAKPKF